MASRDITIACQDGGSHAAYTAGVLPVLLGEFDNLARAHRGGGQAYREPGVEDGMEAPVLVAISGTSGGAISALLGWYGFITGGADRPARPRRRRLAARSLRTLAGNLALNQELGFVDAINRRVEAAPDSETQAARKDRRVQVDRIIMDSDAIELATGMDLGANSKLDRDPRLKAALCEHGRMQARRYLTLRRQVGQLCGEFGTTLAGACGSVAGIEGAADGACRATAGRGALLLDGTTLYSAGAVPGAPRALVRWRTMDAEIGGRPVRIEGRSELSDAMDSGSEWRVQAVRITAVAPRRLAAGRQPAADAALTGSRPEGAPAPSSRH
jgi:hypothetical protein